MPREPVCAHAGNKPCTLANPALPAIAFSKVRRSTDTMISLAVVRSPRCSAPSHRWKVKPSSVSEDTH
jgi:hypothetical protein